MKHLTLSEAQDRLDTLIKQYEYVIVECRIMHIRGDLEQLGHHMYVLKRLSSLVVDTIDYIQDYPRHCREALEQVASRDLPVPTAKKAM